MPSKKAKPEKIIGRLWEVEIMLGQGGTTAKGCRRMKDLDGVAVSCAVDGET